MNGQRHTLTIVKVVETAPVYQPKGAKYQVREWKVIGCLDGLSAQYELVVKSLSAKPECQAFDGWVGEVEEDEFKGMIKYKIPTPKQPGFGDSMPPAPPAAPPPAAVPAGARPVAAPLAQPAPTAQPPAQARPASPQARPAVGGFAAYTIQELEDLYAYSWSFVSKLINTMDLQATAAATATFFIAAQREHIKVPLLPPDEEQGQVANTEQGAAAEDNMPF